VPHIRVLRHYIHTPLMVLSAAEALVVMLAAYLGYASRYREFPDFTSHLLPAVTLAVVFVSAMIAMGVYESRVREGMTGMSLRTAVALFLLGATVMVVLSALIPDVRMGSDVLLFATLEAFILLTAFRLLVFALIHEDTFKKQILILGIGQRALKVASRMRRRVDQRAFVLAGFLDPGSSVDQVSEYGVRIINSDMPLAAYCHEHGVEEVVVAMDERRRNLPQGDGGLPLEELMECRLTGINVCDVQQFIEREACKVDVDLLRPSWLVFSDGFHAGPVRAISKQSFDLLASILLLLIAWPILRRHLSALDPVSLAVRPLWRMIRIGAPVGGQFMIEIGAFGTVALMMGTLGEVELSGHNVALKLASFSFMVPSLSWSAHDRHWIQSNELQRTLQYRVKEMETKTVSSPGGSGGGLPCGQMDSPVDPGPGVLVGPGRFI